MQSISEEVNLKEPEICKLIDLPIRRPSLAVQSSDAESIDGARRSSISSFELGSRHTSRSPAVLFWPSKQRGHVGDLDISEG